MNILVLGGTVFVGRAIVEAALARGHRLSLFNRGKSHSGLFAGVEELRGDRAADLSALQGRRWDAAIDTCGYVPRIVRRSAELLASAVGHYTFVSSLSVYADTSQAGLDESAPVGTLPDETVEEVTGETYGPLKALCERAAEETIPGRVLVIRPGLVVGPGDPTDRFTYWPHRISRGGEVLAPGRPQRRVQFIDVRDLAAWAVRAVEERRTGLFNAVGPGEPTMMGRLLDTCREAAAGDTRLTWVSERFLREHEVEPWRDMPLWIPESDPAARGFFAFDSGRAIAAGLTFRPLADTVHATLAWTATGRGDRAWQAGISAEREAHLLEAWRQCQPGEALPGARG